MAVALGGAFGTAWLVWVIGRAYLHVGLEHQAASAFRASAIWGLLLLASFCGFGAGLNAWLFPRQQADWGLRCAWGWGVAIAIGGLLCALDLATRRVLVGLVGMGLVMLAVELARGYRRWSHGSVLRWARVAWARAPMALAAASVFGLGGVAYLASIVNTDFNGNDDKLCYFAFAREILDRGTLSQPFSMRRISAYGAKSLLDAMQIAIPVPDTHLHLLDSGMALLAVLALLAGHLRASPRTSRVVVLLLLLLTVTLPEIRINTATTMTGVVYFLGLYRTLVWRPAAETRGWRAAVPVALLAAGAAGLRQNYLVPIAVLLVLEYGRPIVRGLTWGPLRAPGERSSVRSSPRASPRRASSFDLLRTLRALRIDRGAVLDAVYAAALLGVLLAPWWALAWRWCGTFLFPFAHGNFNVEYSFFEPLKPFEELHYVWDNLCYCMPVKAVPLLLIAAIARRNGWRRATVAHLGIAAFVGFAVLLRAYPDAEIHDLGRYYFGFTFAALLAIALETGTGEPGERRTSARSKTEHAAALALVVAGIALQIYGDRDATTQAYDKALMQLQPEYETPKPWTPPEPDRVYQSLQEAVPKGAPIAVMVDEPGRFDFARNRIESLDMVGAMAPPPGLPLREGPDAMAEYLVSHGYRYAIVVHPDAAAYLYRRDTWEHNLTAGALPVWKRTAYHYLRAFDAFDGLRKSRAHLADAGSMTTLDLSKVVN
jgi:hypothetical protein